MAIGGGVSCDPRQHAVYQKEQLVPEDPTTIGLLVGVLVLCVVAVFIALQVVTDLAHAALDSRVRLT